MASLSYARPPRNFLSFAAMEELNERLVAIAEDETVRVVMLMSAVPGYFAAHGDLEDLLAFGGDGRPSGDPTSWDRTLRLVEELPQPVVAAVDGQAWGGGCELVLACTLCLASEDANFAQPEIDLGIIPGAGGTVRLPHRIGAARAAELILTGRVVEAGEAQQIGLVQVLLPAEGFAERALEWATGVAEKPPAALRAATEAVRRARGPADVDALRHEARLFIGLQRSGDAQERQRSALRRYASTPAVVRVVLGGPHG